MEYPWKSLARKFQHTRFEPSGHTTNPEIGVASSISDYVFTWLGLRFADEYRAEYQARNARSRDGRLSPIGLR